MDAAPLAAAALALRDWAVPVLAGRPPAAAPPPDAPAAAWELFLRVERVALPLRARLDRAGVRLPPHAAGRLEVRATRELQRFLSARGQLARLGLLAARSGVTMAVLKGGVAVAGVGEPLDVNDLDVLVPRDRARAWVAEMDAMGYHADGADPDPALPGCFHMAGRRLDQSVEVEVHYGIAFLAGLAHGDAASGETPLRGVARLAPTEHAWHLLVHGGVHHPARRGNLRDLLLLRAALVEAGPAAVRELRRRVRAHPDGAVLHRLLRAGLAARRGGGGADPFRAVAAAAYLLQAESGRRSLDTAWGVMLVNAACSLATGAGAYGRLWAGSPAGVLTHEGVTGGHWVDRNAPWLSQAGRVVARGARLASATVPALALARRARRLAGAAA